MVQGLQIHLPMQGIRVRSLVRELRSSVPCHAVWLKNELEYRKYDMINIQRELGG